MIVGGYQISNILIATLVVASTAGAGVATDSFSGVTEGFNVPLSNPSDNVMQNNQTDDSTGGMDNGSSDNQDSSDDSFGSSDSQDSGSDPSDGSDNQDSSDGGGFLDDVFGGNKEENDTDDNVEDNINETDTSNETENESSGNNTVSENKTEQTVNILEVVEPRPAEFSEPYESAEVPLEMEFEGEDASYEVKIDGEVQVSGQLEGTETINQTVQLSNTGMHTLLVEITRSGEVLESMTREFEVAQDAIQQTGFERTTSVTAGSDATFRLWDDGEIVTDANVYMNDNQGQTDQNGEVAFSIPYQDNITLSTDYSGIEDRTFSVTQEFPEPEITLLSPDSNQGFETPQGEKRDILFEANVDIAEDTGTVTLQVNGSQEYTQSLNSGENNVSTTLELSAGTYDWSWMVETEEQSATSDTVSISVTEVEVENGISLASDPVAGESNIVSVYQDNNPVEGEEVLINGDSIGTTDASGEIEFTVPSTGEITVSAASYEKTFGVGGLLISFRNQIYQGRKNVLNVETEGEQVQGAEVYIDGDNVGSTNSSGELGLKLPVDSRFEVKAVKNDLSSNKTFYPEKPPIYVLWNSRPEGDISDYKVLFNYTVGLLDSGTMTLDVGGEQVRQQDLSNEETAISEQIDFVNSGTRNYELSIESGSETLTKSGTFTTTQDMPPVGISIDHPSRGETISDYKTDLDYSFDAAEDYTYTVEVDSRQLIQEDRLEDQAVQPVTATCLSSGTHNLQITATGDQTGSTSTNSVDFDTTGTPPIADMSINRPEEGKTMSSEFGPDYSVTACESIDFTAEIFQDDDTLVQTFQSTTAQAYEEIQPPQSLVNLDSGSYYLLLTADTGSSSHTVNNSFEVQ